MKKIIITLLVAAAFIPVFSSCSENTGSSSALPDISGKAGEVEIVCPKAQWEAEPGTAIREVLADNYPYLPQSEARFRLYSVPLENFTQVFKLHRNMITLKISDTCMAPSFNVSHNIWSQPQTVVTVYAQNEIDAAEYIRANGTKLVKIFEGAERDRSIANAKKYQNASLVAFVEQMFGGSPYFPTQYSLKKQNGDFVWISYETSFTNQGIFIYKFPYNSDSQFTPKYLIDKRNEILKENVPGTAEGSYMITNPVVVPGFEWKTFNDRKFAEVRSLWDTYNDFMGGPFFMDAFLSQDGHDIIVAEGFVYAPKYNKRDYVRQLEAIVYSWHWAEK